MYCLCKGFQPIVFRKPISLAALANLLLSPLSLTSDVLAILGTEKETDILRLLFYEATHVFCNGLQSIQCILLNNFWARVYNTGRQAQVLKSDNS